MEHTLDALNKLYRDLSKHSQYQRLCSDLEEVLNISDRPIKPRYEHERLHYILQHLDINSKNVLDIGANTGFFSFEVLKAGAKTVTAYEGNTTHASLMLLAAEFLNVASQITIRDRYFLFSKESSLDAVDVILLLNVLHHIGDDFDDSSDIENAKIKLLDHLNCLASKTHFLVLQIGFCWKGDRRIGLFSHGTKREMIDFIVNGTQKHWHVENIGVPEKVVDRIEYRELSQHNVVRENSLGEFLNRPIFILKSREK